jgi:ankyrin repeat protein
MEIFNVIDISDLRKIDENGNTAFHLAIIRRRHLVAKKILDKDPGITVIPNKLGVLPIHSACEETNLISMFFRPENVELTKTMFAIRDNNGFTPIDLACRYRTKMAVLLLIKYGSKKTNDKIYNKRIVSYIQLYRRFRESKKVIKRQLF